MLSQEVLTPSVVSKPSLGLLRILLLKVTKLARVCWTVIRYRGRLTQERLEWYRAMARLSRDGVPVFDAVKTLQYEFEKIRHPLAPLLLEVMLGLRGQNTRVNASAPRWAPHRRRTLGLELQGLVPAAEALLIEAADLSGELALGFEQASVLLEARQEMEGAIWGALAKPLGYALALVALMMYFSIEILPQFEHYRDRSLWPQELQLLAFVADHVLLLLLGVLGVGAGVMLVILKVLPRWTGRVRDAMDRHMFPFTLYASLSAAQLLGAIAGFVSAGLPFAKALEQISVSASPYMHHQCQKLRLSLKMGMRPEKALAHLDMIALEWRWMIVAQGLNTDTALSLKRMAQQMRARAKSHVKLVFADGLGNAMLIVVGLVVYWIYSSMMSLVQIHS